MTRLIIFYNEKGEACNVYGENNNLIENLVGNKPEGQTALGLWANRDLNMQQEKMKCNERGRNILQSLYNASSRVVYENECVRAY